MNHVSLRFALLASLGAVPLACGGTALGDDEQGAKCSSPQTDSVTGLVTCSEGYTHRPRSVTCDVPTASTGSEQATLPRVASGSIPCDADPSLCEMFQYAYCQGGQFAGATCTSGCRVDQDCGIGYVCLCNGPQSWGTCQFATCHTNADCDPGYRCASYTTGTFTGYVCQTPNDTCGDDRDCAAHESCQAQGTSGRQCAPRAVPGRPFLVQQQVRVAPIVRRSDWLLT